jgi:hypothetical protein
MLNPMTLAVLGTLVIAGLAAVDWYVWGVAGNGHLRDERTVRPLTMRELAARLLGGVAATNGEVLMVPPAVARACSTGNEEHHGQGFKKVA